mgnify:FL=1
MMFQAVLSNRDHPKYGVATIPFPIPHDQYAHCMELLEALEIGDAVKADCKVEEIDSFYAATVVVKYKVYVYTSQLTFKQYDYSTSTTPSTRNLTILADSSLGNGSALFHLKYVNGAVA